MTSADGRIPLDKIDAAVQAGVEHFKRIDILVNNAGIGKLNSAEKVLEQDFVNPRT